MSHYLQLLLICLGCDLGTSARFPLRRYFYVDIYKSWYDARSYCREAFTDLAVFDSLEEVGQLVRPAGFSSSYAWIGLVDEPAAWKGSAGNKSNSWTWSATGKPSRTGYHNFNTPNEPNYVSANELCLIMTKIGKWHDVYCGDNNVFVCFTESSTGTTYTFVSTAQTWAGAVEYCRLHHTDLVVIEDEALNTQIFNMKPAVNVWIGLSRVPWTWADDSPVAFNNWNGGKPSNGGEQHCAAEDGLHQWKAAGCQNLNPFLCHEVSPLKTSVFVSLQSGANLTDPFISAQILHALDVLFRSKGYTAFTLKWNIRPEALL